MRQVGGHRGINHAEGSCSRGNAAFPPKLWTTLWKHGGQRAENGRHLPFIRKCLQFKQKVIFSKIKHLRFSSKEILRQVEENPLTKARFPAGAKGGG
ncbi:hypothetical protein HMPREF9946_03747 [Acetobacteraceae bacterium AT-5844]|nr:hypothetical protein HMPREF9946_03747 [Acetobacteraceae bacterium AT-5844]